MEPFTVSINVARPREEIFEYLADIANHPEFTDHFLVDWHLTREDSYGRGAGARYRMKAPRRRYGWADATFVDVEPPRRIVEVGRAGKNNSTRIVSTYELSPAAGGMTRVELTTETEPTALGERLAEALGQRGWMRRRSAKALRRLRMILEEDRDRGARATVAAR